MKWLGLDHDEGPFYQTQRMDRYRQVIDQFLREGKAYHCYCSREELDELRAGQMARKEKPRYDGRCRHRREPLPGVSPVVRFRNPDEGQVVVNDVVHGPITFDSAELDDLIIARSDGTPTYNFCVMVDDYDMKVTHVIRGDDHINNTPRQINMIRAMGAEPPVYAHVPMILGPDGAKLSKRHGAVSVLQYRDEGFLPEGLLNYLGRLGWSYGDQEIFSLEEMTQLFDIHDVNKSASALNLDKMLWTNQQHMLRSTPERLAAYLKPQLEALGLVADDMAKVAAVAKAQQERARTLKEMAANSVFFFRDVTAYDEKAAAKNLTAETAPILAAARDRLAALPEWRAPAIHEAVMAVATEQGVGLGKVAQPIRVAVSGGTVSPPIDVTVEILGRETTLARLERAAAAIRTGG
jgi:glutamyl-tRNA synthetase